MSDIKKVARQILAEVPESNTQKKKLAYKLGKLHTELTGKIGAVGGVLNDVNDLLGEVLDDRDSKAFKEMEKAFHLFEEFKNSAIYAMKVARSELQPTKK